MLSSAAIATHPEEPPYGGVSKDLAGHTRDLAHSSAHIVIRSFETASRSRRLLRMSRLGV